MNLLTWTGSRWAIGGRELNCGTQVQIQITTIDSGKYWVWGRFEIAHHNNPIFYTLFGRIVPDLDSTLFRFAP